MRSVYTCKSAAALLALLLLCAGCGSDDPVDPDPGPEAYPWPDTREQLMDNFERAYDEMDYEEYELCLHEDFKFFFTNNDIWLRADDLASTQNMFAGNPGVDEYGNPKDGVQAIAVGAFDIADAWDTMDSTHPYFPDADQARYGVQIVFYLGSGENTITITSQQIFYVRAEEVDDGDGSLRTRWFLIGQRDMDWPISIRDESTSWGSVKSLYR